MNVYRTLTTAICITVCHSAFAQVQDMDKELVDLAGKLAPQVKENNKKKVAVLDFTDLQGGASELGRYIAEQLTVNLVMGKRDFSVLDRANLNKILAEHKLTAKGLVDPENAKKLGMFAGVDALILGTAIQKNQNMSLTAKIITTDTAEIVGAARGEFKIDETVQQLGSRAALASSQQVPGKGRSSWGVSKDFGNLRVIVDKIQPLDEGRSMGVYLSFLNKSAKDAVAVAMYHRNCYVPPCTLDATTLIVSTTAVGKALGCFNSDLAGIRSINSSPANLTEIAPGGELKATIAFPDAATLSGNITSFTLQATLVVNQSYKESAYANFRPTDGVLPPGCKLQNLFFEIPIHDTSQGSP